MANRTKFWHFNTSGGFYGELLSNTGLTDTPENRAQALVSTDNGCYHYIVFIKETDQIYTHGNLYDCSTFNGSEVKSLLTGLTSGEILDNDKAMTIIAKLHYLINQNAGNIAVLESEKADKSEVEILRANVEENAEVTAKALNDLNDNIIENEEITSAAINDLYSKIGSVSSGGTIDTSNLVTKDELNLKQDVITDLADIRSGAQKGATALQSYTETDPVFVGSPAYNIKSTDISNWNSKTSNTGTVTGVKVNGTTKSPSNGVVDLGTVITTYQTLKTINGESIVGSGNITISGGSSSGGSGAYAEVNHGTGDTTFTLTPNTFHVWDEVASLTLTLGAETSGVANEYLFQFLSGSTPTMLSLPDDLKWPDDDSFVIDTNKMYQLSILKGAVSVLSWSTAAKSVLPAILTVGTTTELGKAVYAELEKIGTNGILEEGLLYVITSYGNQESVTTFNYDSSRSAYRLTFNMVSNFLNADGYCFNVIID